MRWRIRGCRCPAASCTCQLKTCGCGMCLMCWLTISCSTPPMPPSRMQRPLLPLRLPLLSPAAAGLPRQLDLALLRSRWEQPSLQVVLKP